MTTPAPVKLLALGRRSAVILAFSSALGLVAFGWPLLSSVSAAGNESSAHATDAVWWFLALLPLLLGVVLAELSEGTLDAKAVALLGMLAACGALLRLPGGVGGFELVFFLLIPAGRVYGPGFGFVLGALTLFASALVTAGVGPWLPFQMLGAAWVGFFAGCLPRASGRREIALLAAYGVVSGLAYGLLLDLWFWPFAVRETAFAFDATAALGDNLSRFLAFHVATAMGFDTVRAVTNAALVVVAGPAVLAALRRAARRGAFGATPEFAP